MNGLNNFMVPSLSAFAVNGGAEGRVDALLKAEGKRCSMINAARLRKTTSTLIASFAEVKIY